MEVTDDAAVILPEDTEEGISEGLTDEESFPEDTESSLSAAIENISCESFDAHNSSSLREADSYDFLIEYEEVAAFY